MRRAFLTIVLLLMASAAFAGDARVRVTLKPEVVDVEAAARELAETYAAKVVAIEGNNVLVELSIARAGLVARDPHVAAVTVLGSAAAAPPVQRSSAAPAPQRSFVPRTNNSCTPPGLPCSTGTYLYDGGGNIKQIGNDTFVYDEVSRLTSATLPSAGGVGETYTYDAFGNMQSVKSTSDEGRPVITTEKSTNHLAPSTLAAYDEAGNLKSWPGHTYTYDAANMLIDMVATGGEHAAYIYTADDERIAVLNVVSSTAYEGTWRLRGLDNKVVREYHESNGSGQAQPWSWSRDYVYRGGLLLSSYLRAPGGGEKRYDYHLDHLGTPRLITDAAGRKISAHNYYPFGAEITWTDAVAETMTFTGHERDSSTTAVGPNRDYWYYMHARYDSPNLGRFLSLDPKNASTSLTTPQKWNLYSYTLENPLKYTDPDGRDIVLQVHEVTKGPDFVKGQTGYEYHISIRIEPNDQGSWTDDRFAHVNEATNRHYATLGAGPQNPTGAFVGLPGSLVGKVNRGTDVDLSTKILTIKLNLGGKNENDVIKNLFAAAAAYKNDAPYQLFPTANSKGYNSNSYAAGLLRAVGVALPTLRISVPGYDKPLLILVGPCAQGRQQPACK